MNQPETTLTVTLTGKVAEWLEQEADSNTRTPSQQVAYILTMRKRNQEQSKRASEERKAKRKALFGSTSKRAGTAA